MEAGSATGTMGAMSRDAGQRRTPLLAAALNATVVRHGGLWSSIEVVNDTGSTNTDVAQSARSGADEGLVRIAETQHAGRGRLNRNWLAPARSSITMSVLLRPPVSVARLGWLPLLAGVAVAEACGRLPGLETALKWPNDLLVRLRGAADRWGKCGGILAETVPAPAGTPLAAAVVVGIGINVYQAAEELPEPGDPRAYPPTSLALAGVAADRQALIVAVLDGLADWYRRWTAEVGDPVASGVRDAYRENCLTVGRDVTVFLPGGASLVGTASDIDDDGRLVVSTPAGEQAAAAGDVQHVR